MPHSSLCSSSHLHCQYNCLCAALSTRRKLRMGHCELYLYFICDLWSFQVLCKKEPCNPRPICKADQKGFPRSCEGIYCRRDMKCVQNRGVSFVGQGMWSIKFCAGASLHQTSDIVWSSNGNDASHSHLQNTRMSTGREMCEEGIREYHVNFFFLWINPIIVGTSVRTRWLWKLCWIRSMLWWMWSNLWQFRTRRHAISE